MTYFEGFSCRVLCWLFTRLLFCKKSTRFKTSNSFRFATYWLCNFGQNIYLLWALRVLAGEVGTPSQVGWEPRGSIEEMR